MKITRIEQNFKFKHVSALFNQCGDSLVSNGLSEMKLLKAGLCVMFYLRQEFLFLLILSNQVYN